MARLVGNNSLLDPPSNSSFARLRYPLLAWIIDFYGLFLTLFSCILDFNRTFVWGCVFRLLWPFAYSPYSSVDSLWDSRVQHRFQQRLASCRSLGCFFVLPLSKPYLCDPFARNGAKAPGMGGEELAVITGLFFYNCLSESVKLRPSRWWRECTIPLWATGSQAQKAG